MTDGDSTLARLRVTRPGAIALLFGVLAALTLGTIGFSLKLMDEYSGPREHASRVGRVEGV
jgi:hypothetical protein